MIDPKKGFPSVYCPSSSCASDPLILTAFAASRSGENVRTSSSCVCNPVESWCTFRLPDKNQEMMISYPVVIVLMWSCGILTFLTSDEFSLMISYPRLHSELLTVDQRQVWTFKHRVIVELSKSDHDTSYTLQIRAPHNHGSHEFPISRICCWGKKDRRDDRLLKMWVQFQWERLQRLRVCEPLLSNSSVIMQKCLFSYETTK